MHPVDTIVLQDKLPSNYELLQFRKKVLLKRGFDSSQGCQYESSSHIVYRVLYLNIFCSLKFLALRWPIKTNLQVEMYFNPAFDYYYYFIIVVVTVIIVIITVL